MVFLQECFTFALRVSGLLSSSVYIFVLHATSVSARIAVKINKTAITAVFLLRWISCVVYVTFIPGCRERRVLKVPGLVWSHLGPGVGLSTLSITIGINVKVFGLHKADSVKVPGEAGGQGVICLLLQLLPQETWRCDY